MPDSRSLLSRLVRHGLAGQLVLAVVLFVPAGLLKFWQAWTFMILIFICSFVFCAYFYKHDLQLLERRLLKREKVKAQRIIMQLAKLRCGPIFVLPGLDYRFGWSRRFLGPVPWWLTVPALLLIPGCYFLFFKVMKANRFAASIIQVEAGQSVAAGGPYRLVRHPMYLGSLGLWLAAPLALGSYVALPAFALTAPITIFRLLNEETFLHRELPGYAEYCQRTRYRLIPFVWQDRCPEMMRIPGR